jgi:hypothetical protein
MSEIEQLAASQRGRGPAQADRHTLMTSGTVAIARACPPRNAGRVRAAEFRRVQHKPAPAAADVEEAVSRLDQELCREVPLLGELGIGNTAAPISTRRTPRSTVAVEKQRVESAVEIVMVGDVAAGAAAQI